jgi:hypothetical protein
MRPDGISSSDLAALLGKGLNWSPAWFSPYQSIWSLTRKLSLATVVPHEDVIQLLAGTDDFEPWMWAVSAHPGKESMLLAALLDVQPRDVRSCWLDDFVRSHREPVVARSLRYCPECMEQDFHSVLHQLHLLETCPIHLRILTTNCPHCGFRQDASVKAIDSFTRCIRCECEMFPPSPGWNSKFEWRPHTDSLDEVASRLRIRHSASHAENLWKPWDHPTLRRGVSQRPYFLMLGQHLLGSTRDGLRRQTSQGRLVRAEARLGTNLQEKRELAGLLAGEIDQVASVRQISVPRSAQLDLSVTNQDVRALWMVAHLLGIGVEHRLRGDFNEDLIVGTLTCDRGWRLSDGMAVRALLGATVHGLYRDASEWLVDIPQGYRWDDWFQLHRARRFPPVWTAALALGEGHRPEQVATVEITGSAVLPSTASPDGASTSCAPLERK